MNIAGPPDHLPDRRPWVAPVKWLLGVALVVAAGLLIAAQRDTLAEAWRRIADPDWRIIAALLLCIIINFALTSIMYWLLTKRYAKDRPLTLAAMTMLISAAALLNYLPMRAGMVGRVAYQKTRFGISYADSGKTVIQATSLSGVVAVMLLFAAAIPGAFVVGLATPIVLGCAVAVCAGRPLLRTLGLALVLRQLDGLAWVGRYYLVFALLGWEIALPAAAAVAAVGMLATFIPFTSNGLGLREWAVGLTASVLPQGWIAAGSSAVTGLGLTADLVNRAAELVITIPAGLIAIWFLHRAHAQQ
ncbi:MAG: flippase-like domain-containing protein [Phycisphaerales bacterium]|nr:flippase-like domain-containing protein [Phycisphaerales bacterium]